MWISIPSAPGFEAGLTGEIRNASTKHVRTAYAGRTVNLGKGKGTKLVSRLVCEAFHGPAPEGKPQVAHADGNPRNNGPFNLYWANQKENEQDKKIHGTWGLRSAHTKLRSSDVLAIRQEAANVVRTQKRQLPKGFCRDLAARYGCSNSNISVIVKGVSWRGVP